MSVCQTASGAMRINPDVKKMKCRPDEKRVVINVSRGQHATSNESATSDDTILVCLGVKKLVRVPDGKRCESGETPMRISVPGPKLNLCTSPSGIVRLTKGECPQTPAETLVPVDTTPSQPEPAADASPSPEPSSDDSTPTPAPSNSAPAPVNIGGTLIYSPGNWPDAPRRAALPQASAPARGATPSSNCVIGAAPISLQNCVIQTGNLTTTDFTGATLSNVLFDAVDVSNANFSNANLTGSAFANGSVANSLTADGADFTNVDFGDTNLSFEHAVGADFTWANLTSVVSLSGNLSDLASTDYIRMPNPQDLNAYPKGARTWWASDDGTAILGLHMNVASPTDLRNEDFTNRDLRGFTVYECDLRGLDFTGSWVLDLWSKGSDFRGADFRDIDAQYKLVLNPNNIWNPNAPGAVPTDLRGAWLDGLNMPANGGQVSAGTLLSQAHLSGTTLERGEGLIAKDLDVAPAGLTFLVNQGGVVDANGSMTIIWQSSTLSGADLHGVDLSALPTSAFSSVSWSDINAAGAIFPAACELTGSHFDDVDFSQATLAGCTFDSSSLTNVDFDYATFTNGYLSNATVTGSTFDHATLTGTNFDSSSFTGGIFTHASAASATFNSTTITAADFSNADLTSAQMQSASGAGANFTGANLTDAQLRNSPWSNTAANFAGANFTGANLTNALLRANNASETKPNFTNANFVNANATNGAFYWANLTSANFTGATVTGANFTGAIRTNVIGLP